MAKRLQVGEEVYVPMNRLGIDRDGNSAFLRTKILEVNDRTVIVDLVDGGSTKSLPTSAVHRNIGVCIFAIGDIDTEPTLIEPLRKSVLQYCRLLLPEPSLFLHSVRSLYELRYFWKRDNALCTHVVLLGHGSSDGLYFAIDDLVKPEELGAIFTEGNAAPKHFVSLCCQTGLKSFAAKFSSASKCESFIGPFHSVHGAIASQFLQSYYGHHLLDGKTTKIAFNKAQSTIPSGVKFRYWKEEKLKKAKRKKRRPTSIAPERGQQVL